MEHRKNAVGTPCPPCESVPFSAQAAQPPQPEAPRTPCGQGLSQQPVWPKKEKIGFTGLDSVFALVFLGLGWMFWEMQAFRDWFQFDYVGTGTAIFCVLYTGAVLAYVYLAGTRPPKESWFWLAVVLCLGLAYALPYGGELLGALHYMMLLLAAQYWVLCVTGRLLKQKKTSNWLVFDLLNAVVILPWGNFMRLPAALWAGAKRAKPHGPGRKSAAAETGKYIKSKRVFAVLGGALAGLLCLCLVLPLLMQADDGFAALLEGVVQQVPRFVETLFRPLDMDIFLLKCMFALPTALFLYGTVYGSVRGRRTCIYQKQEVCGVQHGLRVLPRATVGTALLVMCAVYVLFIAVQANYLFGAFWGALPQGFSYAGYARQGFFELCRVATVNIVILLAANVFSRQQIAENQLLRACNSAVSVLTLLLLATAASKMGLYILAYGLTVKRVLVSVFLVWLAVVFVFILVRQHKTLPLVPLAVFTGAVLFTLLCALPVQQGITAYNRMRVQNGTLAQSTAQANSLPSDGGPIPAQSEQAPPAAEAAQESFDVTVENRAQGLYGLRFDYYARGENVGGQVVMPAGQAFANGENITLTLEKEMFPQGGWGDFGLAVFALCGDGSEILLDDYWQWSAQMGGTYHFVLDGSEETGFLLATEMEAWQYGRTPWQELPEEMKPAAQAPV